MKNTVINCYVGDKCCNVSVHSSVQEHYSRYRFISRSLCLINTFHHRFLYNVPATGLRLMTEVSSEVYMSNVTSHLLNPDVTVSVSTSETHDSLFTLS